MHRNYDNPGYKRVSRAIKFIDTYLEEHGDDNEPPTVTDIAVALLAVHTDLTDRGVKYWEDFVYGYTLLK
jgi:hypothetical protein